MLLLRLNIHNGRNYLPEFKPRHTWLTESQRSCMDAKPRRPRPGSESPQAPLVQESQEMKKPCAIGQPLALETSKGRRVSEELPCVALV